MLPTEPVIARAEDANRFTPEAKNTELFGRDQELEQLEAFCKKGASPRFAWWAITAPGGSGKTRLMLELGERVKSQGWSVKALNSSEYTEVVLGSLLNCRQDLLIISDYAGEHAETQAGWIERMSAPRGAELRLLLAEREAGPDLRGGPEAGLLRNPWYERIKNAGVKPQTLRGSQYGSPEEFLTLKRLDESPLRSLMRSYAEKLYPERGLSGEETETLCLALEQTDPDLCRPLYAMFLADAFLHSGDPGEWDRETVLRELTEREQRHLEARQREFLGLKRENAQLTDAVRRLRLQATVCGGGSLSALPAWREVRPILETRFDCRPIEFLRSLQLTDAEDGSPEEAVAVAPVKPDLFGEFFFLRHLREALPELFAPGWLQDAGKRAFLGRLIQDYGNALPEPLWETLFVCVPGTAEEAEALMDLLWPVTYKTSLDLCVSAVFKMEAVYAAFPGQAIAYPLAVGLYNLTVVQGKTKNLAGCKKTVDRLNCLQKKYRGDREIALLCARGQHNSIVTHIYIVKITDGNTTLKQLGRLHEEYRDDRKVVPINAQVYDPEKDEVITAVKLTQCKKAVNRLRSLYMENPADRTFALLYAQGLHDLTFAVKPRRCKKTINRLGSLVKEYGKDQEIAILYAQSLYNQTHDYSLEESPVRCKKALDLLDRLNNSFPGDRGIAWEYANSLKNLSFSLLYKKTTWHYCNYVLERLGWLCEAFQLDRDIALVCFDSFSKLTFSFKQLENQERQKAINLLDRLYMNFPGDREIALNYANGLDHLSLSLASEKDSVGCKIIMERMECLCKDYPDNREIAELQLRAHLQMRWAEGDKQASKELLELVLSSIQDDS